MPFTNADNPAAAEWTKSPWLRDGYGWATDGRILVRAWLDSELPDNREPDFEKGRQDAMDLFHKSADFSRPWTKAQFPPIPLPPAPFDSIACGACGRMYDKPTRPPIKQPWAIDRGRVFFDAHYLRLLDALPYELELFVLGRTENAYFTDGLADFVGLLMPMIPDHYKAAEAIEQQWGPQP